MAEPLDAFPELTDDADRDLVARHQRTVREMAGVTVDGLVYEYRTQFHRDPLVTQNETAYYLSVRSHVWEEFADRMELTDEELSRLKMIHAEQFAASVDGSTPGVNDAMILTKE